MAGTLLLQKCEASWSIKSQQLEEAKNGVESGEAELKAMDSAFLAPGCAALMTHH